MSQRRICLLLLVGFLFVSPKAFGQAARTPFSSFGLGEEFGNALTTSQGMAGVGISNPQYWYINNQNPALLVFNRLTTFQLGVIGEQRTQTTEALTEKSGAGNLNYLVLSIPVKPGRWTSSIGLMPYTRVNYRLKHTEPIVGTTTNTVDVREEGIGGVNQFSWSNGVNVNKTMSVGMRAAYLFSSIESKFESELTQTSQVLIITPRVVERVYVSGLQFSPALSIHVDSLFKDDYRFNFGLVYNFKSHLNTRFNQRSERLNSGGLIDSVTLISNHPGSITIPQSLSAGISFSKSYKWTAGLDATVTDYSQYRGLTGQNPYAKNSLRLAAGFEFTPDQASLSSYLKRVTYRTGVSLENQAYLVNGNAVKDFGITFGLSLPVSRVSSLDLALKVGKKGDKALNTVEENYIKLYFGLTFNDQWFIKRRFD